jgi:hypothetical protein
VLVQVDFPPTHPSLYEQFAQPTADAFIPDRRDALRGLAPKIVVTKKWPTRAFSLVAPVSSSVLKCLRSVFRQIGLLRRSRTTKQISSSRIPRAAMISTFFFCSSVPSERKRLRSRDKMRRRQVGVTLRLVIPPGSEMICDTAFTLPSATAGTSTRKEC